MHISNMQQLLLFLSCCFVCVSTSTLIDRKAVVTRHNVKISASSSLNLSRYDVLAVGNGQLVFNAGIDALQTFNQTYQTPYDLNIMADWGWHTQPWSQEDPTYALRQYNFSYCDTLIDGNGTTRKVPYFMGSDGYKNNTDQPEVISWMMNNPHKISLGQISLRYAQQAQVLHIGERRGDIQGQTLNTHDDIDDGTPVADVIVTRVIPVTDMFNATILQDMWQGTLTSNYVLDSGRGGNTTTEALCGYCKENDSITLSCGNSSQVISSIGFIYYGIIYNGTCGDGPGIPPSFSVNASCNASSAKDVVDDLCLNQTMCTIEANNGVFGGDPCLLHFKSLAIANVTCMASPFPAMVPLSISVTSTVHPDVDLVGVRVNFTSLPSSSSPWISEPTPLVVNDDHTSTVSSPLALRLAFSYATGVGPVNDWDDNTLSTTTILSRSSDTSITLYRTLDSDGYRVDCSWSDARWSLQPVPQMINAFDLVMLNASITTRMKKSDDGGIDLNEYVSIDFMCLFTPGPDLNYPVGAWLPWMQNKINITRSFMGGIPLVLEKKTVASENHSKSDDASVPANTATSTATGWCGRSCCNGMPSSLDTVLQASATAWSSYWNDGAFLDLSSSTTDPRAYELERRMILSQYLLRIHNAGAEPPAETGLLVNSWSGKHHLEMRFWHHAHFGMWNRTEYLHHSDGFYIDLLPNVSSYALWQGYKGARWLKETASVMNRTLGAGIDVIWPGLDYSPFPFSSTPATTTTSTKQTLSQTNQSFGTLLTWEASEIANAAVIWQQPHPIWLADLERRSINATSGHAAALERMLLLQDVVFGTADYLSTRPFWNESDGHFWLGPPILGAEEMGANMMLRNPSFELVQFAYALDVANEWRELFGLPQDELWATVALNLSKPYVDPGSDPLFPTYSFNYDCACVMNLTASYCPSDRFGKKTCSPLISHPSMAGLYGMINGRKRGDVYGVNTTILNNTLYYIVNNWGWGNATTATNTWGWDVPFVVLALVRIGGWNVDAVIDFFLMDALKNSYLPNGHNYQGDNLPAYLPGNGGILLGLSMMAAGSSGGDGSSGSGFTPFFPPDWQVQAEGFVIEYP